tara:strand:- start:4118 stop:6646 length:2529 start_codon:yes stop_codon:yes gene_type:complete
MRRRSPVRSVLAERKMFAGGGMLPISTPMKKEPSGILASSEPLIDAVSQEILAPMMGGAMPMAQGGIARFQTGGTTPRVSFNFNPNTFEEKEFAPRAGRRTQIGIGAPPIELRERLEKGPGELVKDMFPYEAGSGAGFFGAQLSRPGPFGLGQEKGPSRPIVDVLRAPLDFLDQAARGLSQVNQKLGESLVDFGQAALSKRETGFINSLGQISAVNDALRRAPEVQGVSDDQLGSEISNIAKIAIAESPNITGDKLSERIAKDVFDKYEVGYSVAASDVEKDIAKAQSDMREAERKDADISVPSTLDLTGTPSFRSRRDIDVTQVEKDFDSSGKADQKKSDSLVNKSSETAVTDVENFGKDASDELVAQENVDLGGQDEEVLKDPGSNPFSIESAIKEFTEAMPEYERSEKTAGYNLLMMGAAIAAGEDPNAIRNIAKGVVKTLPEIIKDEKEAEKYLRSAKMAGAKYAFSKRDKLEAERRAEERAKNTYYLDKDITVTGSDGQPVTYKKGWNRFSDKTVNEINTVTNQALVPIAVWKAMSNEKAANLEAKGQGYEKTKTVEVKLNDRNIVKLEVAFPKPGFGGKPIVRNPGALTSRYFEAAGTNDSLLAIANNSADLLTRPNEKVTGFNSLAGRFYDLQRAFGKGKFNLLKTAAISTDDDDHNKYYKNKEEFNEGLRLSQEGNEKQRNLSDQALYNTQLRFLAIRMAPLLLGESGKTISDGDRRLIASALGMAEDTKEGGFKWIGASSISKDLLLQRVNEIRGVLRRNRENLDNTFAEAVKDYGGTFNETGLVDPSKNVRERKIGQARQRSAELSPFTLFKTEEKDPQGNIIYDIRRTGNV